VLLDARVQELRHRDAIRKFQIQRTYMTDADVLAIKAYLFSLTNCGAKPP
jgi:hypothetical protein